MSTSVTFASIYRIIILSDVPANNNNPVSIVLSGKFPELNLTLLAKDELIPVQMILQGVITYQLLYGPSLSPIWL